MCSKVNSVEWLQTLLLLSLEQSESDPVSFYFEFSYDSVSLYYVRFERINFIVMKM